MATNTETLASTTPGSTPEANATPTIEKSAIVPATGVDARTAAYAADLVKRATPEAIAHFATLPDEATIDATDADLAMLSDDTGRVTMGDIRKESLRAKKATLRTASYVQSVARFGVAFADRMIEVEMLRKEQRARVNARLGKVPKVGKGRKSIGATVKG